MTAVEPGPGVMLIGPAFGGGLESLAVKPGAEGGTDLRIRRIETESDVITVAFPGN